MPITSRPRRRRVSQRTKVYRKRRAVSRRKRRNMPQTTIIKGVGLPDVMAVKVRFQDKYDVSGGGVAPYTQVFRGNGPYDPDQSGAGGSCAYWNSYTTLYDMYRCYGSKIKVTFASGSAHSSTCVLIPYNAQNAISGFATATDACELKRVRYCTIGPNNAGNNVKTLKAYSSVAQVLGVNPIVVRTDDAYRTGMSNTPTREFYWGIIVQNMDETTNPTIRYNVQITYYCKLYRSDFPT